MKAFVESIRSRFVAAGSETRAAALGGMAMLILVLAGVFGSVGEASADHGTGNCAGLSHGGCTNWSCTAACCYYLCDPPHHIEHRYCLPENQPCWEEQRCASYCT